MSTLRCTDCGAKIGPKNFDEDFGMYECPKCEGLFTLEDLAPQRPAGGSENGSKPVPAAKGKKRRAEREADEEALDEQVEKIAKDAKKTEKISRHRDEMETGPVLNVVADEIEILAEEMGISMNRLNAREFYAMNLVRPLLLAGHHPREQDVPTTYCKEHK